MLSVKTNVGLMDRLITFQEKLIGDNPSNEDEESGWIDIALSPTVYASREDKSGREVYAADKLTGFQGHIFRARYRDDIKIEMRLLCDGLAHNIISIAEVGRRRYIEIATETGYQYIEALASS